MKNFLAARRGQKKRIDTVEDMNFTAALPLLSFLEQEAHITRGEKWTPGSARYINTFSCGELAVCASADISYGVAC